MFLVTQSSLKDIHRISRECNLLTKHPSVFSTDDFENSTDGAFTQKKENYQLESWCG